MDRIDELKELALKCKGEISKEIIGQNEVVEGVLLGMFTGGNILLHGMPGLGKTRLVQTVSNVFDLNFKRIQFTPDLMPADITGTNVIERTPNGTELKFRKGPVFANIVLADEINRATPKTQSALLEAMQEHTVSIGNETYALPKPFFVLATENPIDLAGTYSLPEAQMDRFMLMIDVKFPDKEQLGKIVKLTERIGEENVKAEGAKKVMGADELLECIKAIGEIPVSKDVLDYVVSLVCKTHEKNPLIREGASPRAAQSLIRAGRARAFLNGRLNVSFEDIKSISFPVLRHRIILSFDAISEGKSADDVIGEILKLES